MVAFILGVLGALSLPGCSNNNDSKNEYTNSSIVSTEEFSDYIEETTIKEVTESLYVKDDRKVYTTGNVNLRSSDSLDSDIIKVIEEYSKLERLETNGIWDHVKYNDSEGYVSSKYTKKLTKTFVEVDISKQNLKLYKNNKKIYVCDIVSGMKGRYDTRVGCHPIYTHERNRYLKGNGYKVYVYYWMGFDGGIGIHDADNWRYGNYGGNIYKSNGSHGCVSVSYSDAEFIYKNTNNKDLVLVHK